MTANLKKHPKFSKLAKFGCEILKSKENIYSLAKLAIFVYIILVKMYHIFSNGVSFLRP